MSECLRGGGNGTARCTAVRVYTTTIEERDTCNLLYEGEKSPNRNGHEAKKTSVWSREKERGGEGKREGKIKRKG